MIGFRSLYIYSGLVIVLIVIALSNISVKPVKNKVPESVPLYNHKYHAHKQDS